MGLLSGYVGKGPDTIIIDDPYKSAQDAESPQINTNVWRWWSATARPRIKDETNVIVMYHPYNDNDLAARLEKEGGFEKYRFPAIADANEDGSDPTGRNPGEVLSPMRSLASLEFERANNPVVFAAQFQGRPAADVGAFFKRELVACDYPQDIIKVCRAWDIAATFEGGDYTAGVKIAKLRSGRFIILDVILLQAGPDEVDDAILSAAKADGKTCEIRLAEDPGSAGKRDAASLVKKLAGYTVTAVRVSGPKESRARPLASQVNVGNVGVIESSALVTSGPYRKMTVTNALRRMFAGFPHSSAKKDGVDAASDAFEVVNESSGKPATTARPATVRDTYAPNLRY
jgi:predicted phage terminase large subunit-like protein